MNPNEALSLGSISQITMPSDLRKVLAEDVASISVTTKLNRCKAFSANSFKLSFNSRSFD